MKRNIRDLLAVLISIPVIVGLAGCGNRQEKSDADKTATPMGTGTGGGLSWDIPGNWTQGPEKAMRLATYVINPTEGDSDSAECAVFYFGPTSGGGTMDNIRRWASQFEQPDGGNSLEKAAIDSVSMNGLNVVTMNLGGTYLVSSGPMMQVSDKRENYRLLGAIVEGPQGSVFFKLTGPRKTVESVGAAFDALLKSIKPGLT
jgi:hypothetical protein